MKRKKLPPRDGYFEPLPLETLIAKYDQFQKAIKAIEIELRYRCVSLATARKRITVYNRVMAEREAESNPPIKATIPLAVSQKVPGWGMSDDGSG